MLHKTGVKTLRNLLLLILLNASLLAFDSNNVIYAGGKVVDLELVIGTGQRVTLYSDEEQTGTWTQKGQWIDRQEMIYFSDVLFDPCIVDYRLLTEIYNQQSGLWEVNSDDEISVQTHVYHGTLHNDSDWTSKLERSDVNWTEADTLVGDVVLADGYLNLSNQTLTLDGTLTARAPGELYADNVVFQNNGATQSVKIEALEGYGGSELTTPIKNSTFNGVNVILEDCFELRIYNNAFTGSGGAIFIATVVGSYGNHIEKNSGILNININGQYAGDGTTCTENVISNNTFDYLDMGGSGASNANIIEHNQANYLEINGNQNLIRFNRGNSGDALNFKVAGNENEVTGNRFASTLDSGQTNIGQVEGAANLIKANSFVHYLKSSTSLLILGAYKATDNTVVEQNRFEYLYDGSTSSAYARGINLHSANYVTVKQNLIKNYPGYGIYLYDSDANNIENNAVRSSRVSTSYRYKAIEINSASDFNVIAFNHLYSNATAMYIAGSQNGIHENIVNNHYKGILVVSGASNTSVYDNIFQNNGTPADDDGSMTLWNKPKTAVNSNIVGGSFLGGNYWDDYSGADGDDDGLGDTPRGIAGDANSSDALPLIWQGDQNLLLTPSAGRFSGDTVSFTAKNSGSTPLYFITAVIDDGGSSSFTVENDTCSGTILMHDQTCGFDVIFAPDDDTEKRATLKVITNDTDGGETSVALTAGGSTSGSTVLPSLLFMLL